MLLELSEEEAEAVREVLDVTLHELSYEIASADRPEFRQMLRHRRELLGHALSARGRTDSEIRTRPPLMVAP